MLVSVIDCARHAIAAQLSSDRGVTRHSQATPRFDAGLLPSIERRTAALGISPSTGHDRAAGEPPASRRRAAGEPPASHGMVESQSAVGWQLTRPADSPNLPQTCGRTGHRGRSAADPLQRLREASAERWRSTAAIIESKKLLEVASTIGGSLHRHGRGHRGTAEQLHAS
jgi:hypothetical protein